VLISKVKTTPVTSDILTDFVHTLEDRASPLLKGPRTLNLFGGSPVALEDLVERAHRDPRWTDDWYRKWFRESILLELIVLNQLVLAVSHKDCRDVGLVAFSDILRRCSNASSAYPNVMFDKSRSDVPSATPQFIKRLRETASSVAELESALANKPLPRVLLANARSLPIPDSGVDAVITHPPYIASIPYAEYGQLSLTWLGHDARPLDRKLTGGRRGSKDVVERFMAGFSEMILETWRVLKPGGKFSMLLGSPTVRGKRWDLPEMGRDLACSAGFGLLAVQYRSGTNRRADLMGREALLFFEKP